MVTGAPKVTTGRMRAGSTKSVGWGVGSIVAVGAPGWACGVEGIGVLTRPKSTPPGVAVMSVGVMSWVATAIVCVGVGVRTGVQVGVAVGSSVGVGKSGTKVWVGLGGNNKAMAVSSSVGNGVSVGGTMVKVAVAVAVAVGVKDGGGVKVAVGVALGV